jgi:hypothetical protein
MGKTTVYLLPDLGSVAPTEYAQRVKALLVELEIIWGEASDELPDFYPPGDKSLAAFENTVNWEAGFENCIIYGSERKQDVPQDPSVYPRCPNCSTDVTDVYYQTINDADEFEPDKPDDELRVKCPNCAGEHRLDQLVDDKGIFLVNAYVNFDDIPGSLRPEWLSDVDKRLGITHRCIEYWYT